MKKPAVIVALAIGGALALGCSTITKDEDTPFPQDTRNNPPGPAASTDTEKECFDDDLAMVRKMAKERIDWVRPASCAEIPDARFWEIHRQVLLKFEANG